MSDLYHNLLVARQEALASNGTPESSPARKDASERLIHLLTLASDARMLDLVVRDSKGNFAVFAFSELSRDDENDVILLGGSRVLGHTDDLPTIECDHDHAKAQGNAKLFSSAFLAASYASNPKVAQALDDLRAQANALRAKGDVEAASALDKIARNLDLNPLSADGVK